MPAETATKPLKILLLGANGRTGRAITRQALTLNWEVTAVVRAEGRMPEDLARRVDVRVADPCSREALTRLMPGHDAVISVLGPRRPFTKAASVYPRSAEAIVPAMQQHGVRRLLVTSSALLFPQKSWLIRLLKRLVHSLVDAASAMEQRIRASQLDWTIARTSFLTNDETITARVLGGRDFEDGSPSGAVSRNAVAQFLVEELQQGRHRNQTVALFG